MKSTHQHLKHNTQNFKMTKCDKSGKKWLKMTKIKNMLFFLKNKVEKNKIKMTREARKAKLTTK